MIDIIVDNELSIQVVRSKRRRKTSSIIISNGLVKVVVPNQISDFTIKELINKRISWIRKKLQDESNIMPIVVKEYVDGESFTYLGNNYQLKSFVGSVTSVKVTSDCIYVSLPKISKENIKSILEHWYEEKAIKILTEKTNSYAKIIGVSPTTISVGDFKSKWGSCSIEGKISYNWKIIIAPHKILDYIVIHELCHMLEHNHSKEYWRHVNTYCNDFKECRKWLKQNGRNLVL